MAEGMESGRRFEKTSVFQVVDVETLADDEKAAVFAAIEAQRNSTDEKYRVGACAVSEYGDLAAVHNEPAGPEGHAEMNSLRRLYGLIPEGKEKRMKLLALAGARKGESVIRRDAPYPADISFDELKTEWIQPCAKCLEYLHDRTANMPDVAILSVMSNGQVMKTSLKSLLPSPHTSIQVKIEHGGIMPSTDTNGK